MLSLYNNSIITKIDQLTIKSGVSSYELIYRASEKFVQWLKKTADIPSQIHILCGYGNNGADGYQIALILSNRGYEVSVFSLDLPVRYSIENLLLREKIQKNKEIRHISIRDHNNLGKPLRGVLLIDALFGNGLNRALDNNIIRIIEEFESNYANIYAVDVPSGLMPHDQITDYAFHCKATCSFQFPKLSFFDPLNEKFVGLWKHVDIGLNSPSVYNIESTTFLLEKSDIANIIQPRGQFDHKGLMGKVLIVLSEKNMMGAATLMSEACIKMGAGYTLLSGQNLNPDLSATIIPEAILVKGITTQLTFPANVIAIGPGMGISPESKVQIRTVLVPSERQLVIDADALNIIAEEKLQSIIPKGSIITPHIKEFGRLFGELSSHNSRIELQKEMSKSLGIFIILKGRYTSISCPEGYLYYNRTGNPGLAKAGSGDVLTGMVAALLAQGYPPLDACKMGVFIHGSAADLLNKRDHEITMRARDLISFFPDAINDILEN